LKHADLRIEAPRSLTEIVLARLEQAIVDGEFGLGEAIPEETLAKAIGVSRTPVRDALAILQASGLVSVVSKKGSYVFRPTAEDAAALCEYRFLLESQGLRLSHGRARDAALAAMEESLAAMQAVLEADAVAYGRADTRFHRSFLDHCGNPYLQQAYQLAGAKVAALRTHLTAHVVERRAQSFAEHREMVACFAAGRIDAMLEILAGHIDRTRVVYMEALGAG
jgi:DNA-binding GntR family transcriptional regulator